MRLQLHFRQSNFPSLLIQTKSDSPPIKLPYVKKKKEIHQQLVKPIALQLLPEPKKISTSEVSVTQNGKNSKLLVLGAVSVGVVLFLMDKNQALAFGPEGPLMEEFWDNMRRYALYALTVSTGVLWAVFQPIYELLKNPISAILILTIMGGGFYIVSQVVSAMVGITDFSYDYNY